MKELTTRTEKHLEKLCDLIGPLKAFKPVSYVAPYMDMVHVCTEDTSGSVSHWRGLIHLETIHNHYRQHEPLIGCHIFCYDDLQSAGTTHWVPILLLRALKRDLTESGRLTHVSAWTCCKLYTAVFGLLLMHPRTWKLRA